MSQQLKHHIYLIGTCFFVFFLHLDVLEPTIMEARNLLTARDMLSDNNWLLTTLNGEPRYEKPPLPTWIVAFFAWLFNTENLRILRLPSAIISTGLVISVYHLVKTLTKDKSQALIAGLVLATSFYVVFAGRQATWDIFTHGFMLFGIYGFFRSLTTDQYRYTYIIISGICIGLSILSKGPVALYALFLPFTLAYLYVYRCKGLRLKSLLLLATLSLCVGLSWYIYVYIYDAETLSAIARQETNAWEHRNKRPFYYYWSFFLQSGAWSIIALCSLIFPFTQTKQSHNNAYRLSALWVIFSVILLSLIPEKKSRYLMPVLIPLAITISFYLKFIFNKASQRVKHWRLPAIVNFYIISITGLSTPVLLVIGYVHHYDIDWIWAVCLVVILVVVSILMITSLYTHKLKQAFFMSLLFIGSLTSLGFPALRDYGQNDRGKSIVKVKQHIKASQLPLYTFSNEPLEILWSYGEQIPILSNNTPHNEYLVLVNANSAEHFEYYFLNKLYEVFDEIDINNVAKNSRHYKNRKRATIYKIYR